MILCSRCNEHPRMMRGPLCALCEQETRPYDQEAELEFNAAFWCELLSEALDELLTGETWADDVLAVGKARRLQKLYKLARAAHLIEVTA